MADLTGRMIGAMQADVKTFTEIEADPNAMGQAITVIVIAGIVLPPWKSTAERTAKRAGTTSKACVS